MGVCEKCGCELDSATGLCSVCDIVEISRKKAEAKRKKMLITTLCVLVVFVAVAVAVSLGIKGVVDEAKAAAEMSRVEEQRLIASYYEELVGEYQGTYKSGSMDAGLTLTVYEQEGEYFANFKFYSLPDNWTVESGEYILKVFYNEETEQFDFIEHEWIEQPDGYGMVELSGRLEGDVLSGTSPTEFSVTRVSEQSEEVAW